MRTIAALVILASLLPSPHAQGPLVVHASRCLDPVQSGLCTPGLGFGVVFSHDIDESSLANRIRISPDPGPLGIGVRGSLV